MSESPVHRPPAALAPLVPFLFHGWIVVAGAFAVMFLIFGSAYSFTAFFESLQNEFDASRGSVSLVFSISGFLFFAVGALSGPLADRFGPRGVVLFGVLVTGAGLLLAAAAGQLWQVYLAYGIGVGIGVGFAYVPAIGAVQRWFVRRRGMASGLAVSGIGLGTLTVPPAAALLIESFDWRTAYMALGAGVILLGGLAALAIDQSPERRGLQPDGDPEPAVDAEPEDAGLGLGEALRSGPFKLLYGSSLLMSLGLFIPFVHLVPYAMDHGMSRATAILLLGLIGVGSTLGRFLLGGIADRLGRRISVAGMFGGMTLMLLWWLIATTFWELAVFALIFGTCYGGFVALIPALTADYFGSRNASGTLGVLYTSVAFGTLAGPALAGVAFDLQGSYSLPIAASVVTGTCAVICMWMAAEPAKWRAEWAGKRE